MIKDIQKILGVTADGIWGARSQAALDAAIVASKTSSARLSPLSLDRLKGVDPELAEAVYLAASLCNFEIMVVEGLRSKERQAQLYAQGRTTPGNKVTWTLKSKHIDGLAVDLAPIQNGQIDWTDLAKFDAMAKAMFTAAAELGIKGRWGADWNQNGRPREKGESDSPHFELA